MSLGFVWMPRADAEAVAALGSRLEAAGVVVARGHPLAASTTFGVGGPAALFVEPPDREALSVVLGTLATTTAAEVPLLVLGRGSNLLIADTGFPGLVLRLGRGFAGIRRDGQLVEVGGAFALPRLAVWAARHGLAGLEFAAAIPASVGGAVRMNAGAHGGEVVDGLVSVDVADPASPAGHPVPAADLSLGYRRSTLPPRSVVTAARFRLTSDDPAAIMARLAQHRDYRRRTQPLRSRSCGSTFTNPPGGSAGKTIDAAGLKGLAVGGARVSDTHANFIVTTPGTKAADVLALIDQVRAAVRAQGGPDLVPELRAVGDFGLPRPPDPDPAPRPRTPQPPPP